MNHNVNLKLLNPDTSHLKFCDFGPKFPKINGDVVIGRTVDSGASFDNPSAAGWHIEVDDLNEEITATKVWDVEISGFVDKDDGQKVLIPAFEPEGRCFIRGRSGGSQADGENTTNNGIMEIDPKTGDYDPQNRYEFPNSGTLPYTFDISSDGVMYADENGTEQIRLLDLDYNTLDQYFASFSEFSGLIFGVNSNRSVAMVGRNTDQIEYFNADKSVNFVLTNADFPGIGSQMVDLRLGDNHIYLTDNDDQLFAYNITDRQVDWSVSISNLGGLSVGWDGSLYVGRGPSTEGRLRKIDSSDGSTIWDVLVVSSGGTSPSITQVGQLSTTYLYAFAGVLGSLRILKVEDGTVLSGSVGLGRGNIGIHPFNNNYIQNFEV